MCEIRIKIMSYFRKAKFSKLVATVVGFSMVLGVMFSGAPVASAQTAAELQAQIAGLLATIQALQAQLGNLGGSTGGSCSFTFTLNLKVGSTGTEVMNLQKFLNMSADTKVSASGAGSPGNETSYFGPATQAAVIKFQNKYKAEVLTPVGLSSGTGFWGASSRAKANMLCSAQVPPVVVPPGTPTTGTSLMVAAGTQPAATLAPEGASRLPFTRFTLTAGADGAVTVNGVTVQRVGLGSNSVFAGVVLLDGSGEIMDVDKTLNANNQATIGGTFIVPAGTTKSYTIAGNMLGAGELTAYAGQVVGLNLVAVNTSATVSGSLPISGASHTVNATLDIGTVTAERGVNDPNAAATKEVGTTDYTFTAVKLNAGSAEKVRLNSIRFNQAGSAATGDLANVKAWVDGVAYTPVISTDGKYYTFTFGSGIVIDKGLSKEIILKGDIAGGSARTVSFDVYKYTDINVTGETFGYGITPTDGGAGFGSTSPVYNASDVTVANGSMVVSRATSVAAQNIAIQQSNQVLGGFDVDVKGEAISVGGMVFNFDLSVGEVATNVDNISLVSSTGAVLAGPVDATGAARSGTITFSDTVTFPIGKTTIILKGQLTTAFEANDTIVASTTPSTSATASNQWTTVRGQVTGNTIYPTPYTAVSGATMTIKSATVSISTSATPAAQTVVAGAQDFLFATYQFDGTSSGEDVKFTTLSLDYNYGVAADDVYLTGCQLWDGATALNTGSNVVNPNTTTTGDAVTFTLDSAGLLISKGTVKNVSLKCDVSSAVTSSDTFSFDIDNEQTGSGATSGATVTVTGTGSGATMTGGAAGALSVALDASSPAYKVAAAQSTGVLAGVFKFTATSEDVTLSRVALELSGTTASSSPANVTMVTLKNSTGTSLGTTVFTGTSRFATSTLTSAFIVPKNGDNRIYAYVDLADIGTGQATTTSGILVQVNWDGNGNTGTQGVGSASGTTINATGSTTAVAGVRVMNTVPTFARLAIPSSTLSNGTEKKLMRFSVTANSAGDLAVAKYTVGVATTGVTITNLNIHAFEDSGYTTSLSGHSSDGQLDNADKSPTTTGGDVEIYAENSSGTTIGVVVPAGATRYFELRGDVASASSGDSTTLTLQGDAAYPSLALGLMGNVAGAAGVGIEGDAQDDLIWSPYSTTSSGITAKDWTNGYAVPGLGSSGFAETLFL